MSKLTQSAKLRSCSLRLPNCTNEGVVFAHAQSVEKGMGRKSPDWWGCYACHTCHDALDSRIPLPASRAYINDRLLKAIFETQQQMFADGLLKIA
jgi:hypothetical protein